MSGGPAAEANGVSRFRHECEVCETRVGWFEAHRWQHRAFCSLRCVDSVRQATLKASHDAADRNPMVCRCEGAPRPLEAHGQHCVECRRMFSAGVREMLRKQARPSLGDRLRSLLYTEIRVPVLR